MTTLSERYFRPKAFELGGRVYEWLGVLPFKRALMGLSGPAKPTANAYVLGGRSLDDVRDFERRSRRSEAIHGIGVLCGLLMLALGLASTCWSVAIPGGVVLAANFHCFMLQRYNRIRIYRLFDRQPRRDRPMP